MACCAGPCRLQARGLPRRNGKRTMPTTKSDLIGIDVDEQQRSWRWLRRTSTTAQDAWDNLSRTPRATHSLSCDVLDRALNLIEEFQRMGPSRGTTEITLVERQQKGVHLLRTRSETCGNPNSSWWTAKKGVHRLKTGAVPRGISLRNPREMRRRRT